MENTSWQSEMYSSNAVDLSFKNECNQTKEKNRMLSQ